jgi:hypothetical protein
VVTYGDLIKDIDDSEVELTQLPVLLHELSDKIAKNWLELKSNHEYTRSIRKTALNYAFLELKPSFKLNIITKMGNEVNKDTLRQVLAGLGISDLHIGEDLITTSTPDPKLTAAIIYTLNGVLGKRSITVYSYPMVIEGSRKLSISYHIMIKHTGELSDFTVNVDKVKLLINNSSISDTCVLGWFLWLMIGVTSKLRRVFALFGMLLMACLVGVPCLVGLLVMASLVMLIGAASTLASPSLLMMQLKPSWTTSYAASTIAAVSSLVVPVPRTVSIMLFALLRLP